MMQFNNQYGIKIFDDFYSSFADEIEINWKELMHETIDLRDTLYMSICFRPTTDGDENDIIENTDLCKDLQLTDEERFALVAHEIGHFVEMKNQRGKGDNEEEIACDEYAVVLGLEEPLKSALRKIVDAKLCSEVSNEKIKERISSLGHTFQM